MRTIEINLYQFNELSPEAQQKAIDSLQTINVEHDWWQFTYDDADSIGVEINGFGIDWIRKGQQLFASVIIDNPKKAAKLIIANHGKDCETYKIAESFLAEGEKLAQTLKGEENEYELEEKTEELEEQFIEDISRAYATILSNEYGYLTSTEAIIEIILANEYEFTEKGELH